MSVGLAVLAPAALLMVWLALKATPLLGVFVDELRAQPVAPLTLQIGGVRPDGHSPGYPLTIDVWVPSGGTERPRRLLVYTPGNGGERRDNARLATMLADLGWLVVALDDVERDAGTTASALPQLQFDFSSDQAYQGTLALADRKLAEQVNRISRALDGLSVLSRSATPPQWLVGVDLQHAGAFGWSFGGATAAEASIVDARVVAAANMDGWLFGRAALGAVNAPYLVLMSDYAAPGPGKLQNPDASIRNEADLTRRDLAEEHRLAGRVGNLGLRFSKAVHENFSDKIENPAFWRAWLGRKPGVMREQIAACLNTFFQHSLSDGVSKFHSGLSPDACAGPGIQRLKLNS